ncbi:MAG: hypothetical protein LBG15_10885 [Dysgonamonadaceae bacterium]|nr:hypothetical protein [Dysgonamonadaceae bacterium]
MIRWALHIPSLTGRATVKITPVFYQHAVPDGTEDNIFFPIQPDNTHRY